MGSAAPFLRPLPPPAPTPTTPTALDEPGLLALLHLAMVHVCGSQKAAAIDFKISAGQLTKWLKGIERFGLVTLARHPAVQIEFARLLALQVGLDVRCPDARRARRLRIEKLQRELAFLQDEEMREAA